MIFDLDFFKSINDKYGHFNGDLVLEAAVKNVVSVCPFPVCRWGGEEFAIFVPEGSMTEEIADKILEVFRESSVKLSTGEYINQKVSIGAVSVDDFESLDRISIQADSCLYEAKNTGRDKVVYKEF